MEEGVRGHFRRGTVFSIRFDGGTWRSIRRALGRKMDIMGIPFQSGSSARSLAVQEGAVDRVDSPDDLLRLVSEGLGLPGSEELHVFTLSDRFYLVKSG